MKSVICPIVFNFFLSVAILAFPFGVCDVNNKQYFDARLPDPFYNLILFGLSGVAYFIWGGLGGAKMP